MATENNKPAEAQAAHSPTPGHHVRGRRQEKIGLVTSSKMAKTLVVKVTRMVGDRKYGRVVRVTKKFYAHDETGQAQPGDTVRIVETRPMSKLKRWRLAEVIAHRSSVV
jgi:small subunit ribosomal protein S17